MSARFSDWIQSLRRARPHLGRVELLATLWPGFDHFPDFANDPRLSGIRVNPAMITPEELQQVLAKITVPGAPVPLYYDVKGRQLRVEEADNTGDHLEIVLNHPIGLDLSVAQRVLFKAGGDSGMIEGIEDGGRRLVFCPGSDFGPRWRVSPGESIHIKHPSLKVHGPLFSDIEVGKIQTALQAGFDSFFLSYVEDGHDVAELRELIGPDKEIWLKIESMRGLRYVAKNFRKRDGLVLTAARGDLFVELPEPHQITDALRLIIDRDPTACVGSRILLSVVQRPMPPREKEQALAEIYERARWRSPHMEALRELLLEVFHDPIPSCADYSELAWLLDLGYRRFLLCDELCLAPEPLDTALNAFRAFETTYRAGTQKPFSPNDWPE